MTPRRRPMKDTSTPQRTLPRIMWWVVSVPIYIKILGIGLLVTLLFGGVAFFQIRGGMLETHYQVHGQAALAVALSSRLEPLLAANDVPAVDRELDATMDGFPDVRYIVVQDGSGKIVSHGFTFPEEAPPDLLERGGDLCASCHPSLSPKEISTDLLEVPPKAGLPEGNVRAYRRAEGLVLEVNAPIASGKEGTVRLGVGDRIIVQDFASITKSLLWSLAVCVVVGQLFALVLTYILVRPIRMLVHAANQLGEGDFEIRAQVLSGDEIGVLSHSFNKMADALKERDELLAEQTQLQLTHFERLAAVGRLAAGVAHEINNPLTGVLTFAHMLLRETPQESSHRKDLQTIIEATGRCKEIVQGLLSFSRQNEPHKTLIDLNELLRKVLNLTRNQAGLNHVKIVEEMEPDLPQAVMDPGQIEEVAINVIVNGLDAMPDGGTLTVRTKTITEDNAEWLVINIADTGSGISREDLEHVFDPFFTTKHEGKGTGLGLSLSYGIVEKHGGRVTLASTLGQGTTVTVRLPVAPMEGTDEI
ncbi:sensor histidine kinase [Candidatus Hydrogenedentota bacterium]